MKTALRDIAQGSISFYIKAADNEKNSEIHEGFKAFARDECSGDYTKALEKLLQYYQEDAKFEMLWEYSRNLKIEFDEMKISMENRQHAKKNEDKEESDGTF